MDEVLNKIEAKLGVLEFQVKNSDRIKPWGGVLVIKKDQSIPFVSLFFPSLDLDGLITRGELKPKVMIIAPGKSLSWHYHSRRAELWKVLEGTVGVLVSDSDIEPELKEFRSGELIIIDPDKRHRIQGLLNYGVVAEIWQHTSPDHHSDEDDLIFSNY